MAKPDSAFKSANKGVVKSQTKINTQNSPSVPKTNILLTVIEQLNLQRVILLLALLSCFAYANSLGGDFVFDDLDQVVENKDLRNWSNLGKAFTTHVWAFRDRPDTLRAPVPLPYYRPLFTVLFTIEYQLFGLWQQGWHLVSLLLHILCAIAVYHVLWRLARKKHIAVVSAALFAVYSVHVESVSWISGVTDPLFGVFYLWSFYFYLRFREEKKTPQMMTSLLLFFLSTLAKEPSLTLVPLIFIFAWIDAKPKFASVNGIDRQATSGWQGRLMSATKMSLPYLGIGLIYLAIRYVALGGLIWDYPQAYQGPVIHNLWTFPWVICSYLFHLLFPVDLSIAYNTNYVTSATSLRFLLPAGVLIVIVSTMVYYRKKFSEQIWQALALLFVPLVLALDIRKLPVEYLIADRYLYLSVIGWAFLIALGLSALAEREEEKAGKPSGNRSTLRRIGVSSVTTVALILLLILATARENKAWSNAYALWTNAARIRPDFWAAHYNAGLELLNMQRYAEARDTLNRAAQLKPDEPSVFNVLGQVYTGMGETSRAIESFKRALEIDPEMFESLNNLGTIYFNSGDYPAAERYFKSSLALKPQAVAARYNLALCFSRQNRFAEAIPELEACLKYVPNDAEALYELGLVYEKLGRKNEALATLHKAMSYRDSRELSLKIGEVINRLEK
jgi:protein O-mannosyl-transferase